MGSWHGPHCARWYLGCCDLWYGPGCYVTLASLVLVHNVILAPCLLNEKLDKKGLIATFIIIGGSLVATVSAVRDFHVFILSTVLPANKYSFFT